MFSETGSNYLLMGTTKIDLVLFKLKSIVLKMIANVALVTTTNLFSISNEGCLHWPGVVASTGCGFASTLELRV